MTLSDSLGPTIGGRCKQRAIIFYGDCVIVNFVPKFVAMATRVAREKCKWQHRIAGPKNKGACSNKVQLSFKGAELYRFEISVGCNAKFCNFWMIAMATGAVRGYT